MKSKNPAGIILLCLSLLALIVSVVNPHGIAFDASNVLPGLGLAFTPVFYMDPSRARAAYELIKNVIGKINTMTDAQIIVSESFLNSEQVIQNNKSVYDFKILQQDMPDDRPLNRGVQDNDVFIAFGGRLLIDHRVIGNTNVIPLTYPNQFTFTAANTGAVADLYSLYNGQISYQVGSTVFQSGESSRFMLDIPRTQKSGVLNESEYHGISLKNFDPYLVMSGKATNKLKLEIGLYAGWAGASIVDTEENVMSMFFDGVTLENGAGYVNYLTGVADLEAEWQAWTEKNPKQAMLFRQQGA